MKNLCTRGPALLLTLLLTHFLAGQTANVVTEGYPDGRPKLYKTEVNGQAEGLWLEWYPDGEIRYRARWKDGKGHGRWEYFYANGRLRSEGTYVADLPTGTFREYHPNGQLAGERTYVENQLHGEEISYDVNGLRTERKLWIEGERVIDRPTLFLPGIVSTPENNEWSLSFTPDGKTVYFSRRAPDAKAQKIYYSEKQDGKWSSPTRASFSTGIDEAPFISRDGKHLYFASARPLPGETPSGKFDMNIWRVARTDEAWGEPTPLPPPINQRMEADDDWPYRYEADPTLDATGNLYYWTSLTPTGSADLIMAPYETDNSFGPPVAIPDVNFSGSDSSPVVSPDGQLLCFASYDRSGGFGREDLYCSKKTAAGWGEPFNLGPRVNDSSNEAAPRFSPDGKYLYFFSDRGAEGTASIYYLETRFVNPRD